MRLQNIHNYGRTINLFQRGDDGKLFTSKDSSFYPYFYERDKEGKFTTFDGHKARKKTCHKPSDVRTLRGANSYEADVLYTKRYLIDKIPEIDKSDTRIMFIDIEIKTADMPNLEKADKPISCITTHDSLTDKFRTWYLPDWKNEQDMLKDFVAYVHDNSPDVMMAWNVSFDYTYLHNRIPDFPKSISPINENRMGDIQGVFYPAGISIVDYMILFKKVYMREQSYALDRISQKYLDEKPWAKTDFNEISPLVRDKNINDVKRMLKLEAKFKLMDYYDEVRRFTGCLWEDLIYNSKVLDIYILRESSSRGLVLPTKKKGESYQNLEGAYRRADAGIYRDIYKADVGSMYPNQIINFCLDISNLRDQAEDDTICIDGRHVKQDKTALLPHMAKTLIDRKDIIKKELKLETPGSEKYEHVKKRYDAVKSLVNSLYGVTALPSFRLFNYDVASCITFLSRDLLKYVENYLIKDAGCKVCYTDTDALMYDGGKDEIDLLNMLVDDWAIETYGKTGVNIEFESEGMFTKLLILGKCHYFGYIDTGKGIVKEIKGMEIKRSSSTKFEAKFQEELIERILDYQPKEDIVKWIAEQQDNIKEIPLIDIAFPCKIANKEYKNVPIFVRAAANSENMYPEFKVNKGELFYYIFVESQGKDARDKKIDVIGFTDTMSLNGLKEIVDWDRLSERIMISKADKIFTALNYGDVKLMIKERRN